MIAVIDYDAGNIKSVEKAILALGEDIVVTRERDEIVSASHVILPGVGAFGDAMGKIRQYHLEEIIREVTDRGTPFLGICLGLQLLFESSEECEGVRGLGILPGRIVRLPENQGLKIPHIGWNSLHYPNRGRLFEGIPEESFCTFLLFAGRSSGDCDGNNGICGAYSCFCREGQCVCVSVSSGEKLRCGYEDSEKFS